MPSLLKVMTTHIYERTTNDGIEVGGRKRKRCDSVSPCRGLLEAAVAVLTTDPP